GPRAAQAAREAPPASILVFGSEPDRAATGYGWLRRGESAGRHGGLGGFRLPRRPPARRRRERARERRARGAARTPSWTAGPFASRPAALAAAYDRHLPEMAPALDAIAATWGTPRFEAAL